MFGLTEHLAVSHAPQVIEAIIPTVAIPFLLVGAIISSIATAIAAWFGVTLKADGPRKLLELLLKPKILIAAILLNGVIYGGYVGVKWVWSSSKPLVLVNFVNDRISAPSDRSYQETWRNLEADGDSPVSLEAGGQLELAWETKLPDGSFRGFSLSGNSAFAGGLDGYVYEVDRGSGKILRRFYVGNPSVPMPVVYDGMLFVGEGEHATHHARIYAFDLKTGRLKGAVATKGHTEGDLVIVERGGRKLLFAAAGADGLYAIDPDSLEVAWHAPIRHFDSGVAVSSEGVIFASTGVEKGEKGVTPTLNALEFATGKIIWKVDLGASGWSRPLVFEDQVCVGLGEIYSPRKYGQVACYSQKDGRPMWAMNFAAPVFETPQISRIDSSRMIVTAFDGEACSIDVRARSRIWCAKTKQKGPMFAVTQQDARGRILLTTGEGVAVLDPATGETLTTWKPASPWKGIYAGVNVGRDGWYVIDKQGVARRLVKRGEPLASADGL